MPLACIYYPVTGLRWLQYLPVLFSADLTSSEGMRALFDGPYVSRRADDRPLLINIVLLCIIWR